MWRDKSVVASKRGLRDFLVEAFSLGGINGISASSDTGFEQDCDINVFPLGRCWPVGDLHREGDPVIAESVFGYPELQKSIHYLPPSLCENLSKGFNTMTLVSHYFLLSTSCLLICNAFFFRFTNMIEKSFLAYSIKTLLFSRVIYRV